MPWMRAWLERLMAFGADFSGIGADAQTADFAERYRRLFMPAADIATPAASARCQAALARSAELAAAIAIDASKRLATELANPDPALPPVTSLRQLHELWVECGEAAWATAAHREDFAAAQAELLASFVGLRAGRPA